ncbi:hypothetical protein AAHH72_29580 [Bacillus cereus]|uniref:hypothetical protein n=1 Tax=Bacillus anthracis TaxID=1392 RepID=UPI00317AE9AB
MIGVNKWSYENEDIKGKIGTFGEGFPYDSVGYYVDFYKNSKRILRLGLTVALGRVFILQSEEEASIYKWIWDAGNTFVNELEEEQILIIQSKNVSGKILITDWKDLDKSTTE